MSGKKLVVSTSLQYVLLALGALFLVVFVRQIGGVLLTFLMAAILAYVLNPVVRRLEGWRIPRVVAVLGVFVVLIALTVAALIVLIVPATEQVRMLARRPELIVTGATRLVNALRDLPYVGEQIAAVDREALVSFLRDNMPPAGAILNGALGFIGGVFGLFGTLLNLFLMLIIAIYLLLDRERVLHGVLATIPQTVRDQVLELLGAVEGTLVRYLKAQVLLCVLMGVIGWAIAFFFGGDLAGRYALLIGVWVGVTELIPVIGAFIGAVPAVLLALIESPSQALLVIALFLVAQQIEGNLLVPRIMGGSVGVHPLWVMFAMLSATALYGLVGALFAVPVVAIVSASIRYFRGTLIFARWRETPVTTVTEARTPPTPSSSSLEARAETDLEGGEWEAEKQEDRHGEKKPERDGAGSPEASVTGERRER
jgi:predicted PurR-regulated permease PerM